MIGLVDDDEIFLKTDEVTRPAFVAAGCRCWVYEDATRRMETGYFRPPDEAHESAEDMEPWGRLALEAARRAAAEKRARAAAKAARKIARAKPAGKPPAKAGGKKKAAGGTKASAKRAAKSKAAPPRKAPRPRKRAR
jgi:DNA transformation protein